MESGANKDQGKTDDGATPLFIAAHRGSTLKLSDFWWSLVPTKTKAEPDDGATPLFIAAQKGHLEVVRVLVEHGASNGKGRRIDGETPLSIAAQNGHVQVVRLSGGVGCQQRPRQGRQLEEQRPLHIAAREGAP